MLASAGKRLKIIQEYQTDALDFRAALARMKQAKYEDILLLLTPRQLGHVFVQANQLGYQPRMYSFGVESPELVSIAGKRADGLLYAYSFDAESSSAGTRDFVRRYRETYHDEPDALASNSYDSLMLLDGCAARLGPAAQALKDCVYQTRDYDGVSGVFSFDANGDALRSLFLKTIRDGKFVRVP